MKMHEPLHAWSCGLRDKGSEHRSPDYAVPEIKCPACGVTGGMPHDCETAGRIS